MEVGAAYVSIVPSFKNFGRDLAAQVNGQTRGVGTAAGRSIGQAMSQGLISSGAKMQSVGRSLTKSVTLPILGIGAASIKMSSDFGKSMGNIATLIPNSTERVKELGDGILELSPVVGKSTSDLTDGMYQVISAFGDSADSMSVLKINAKAATAGLATTTDAINLTSAVTKAYGDTSKEAVERTADLGLMTVRLGQTTFPELAASIGKVTPMAEGLNVTQEELFGSMATLTGVTGKAAEVATQMRGGMQALMAPTADAAKAIKQAGFESGAALVEQRGMAGAIEFLTDAAKKSGQPLQKYISSIEGQTFAMALTGAQADTYKKKLAQMGKAQGTTNVAFKEATTGAGAQAFTFAQLRAQAEVAAIKLGNGLAPALRDALEAAQPLIDGILKLANRFEGADKGTQQLIVRIAAAAAAFGPLLIVTGKVTSGVGRTISGVSSMASAMKKTGVAAAGFAQGLKAPASGASAFASRSQRAGGAVGRFGAAIGGGILKGLSAVGKAMRTAALATKAFTLALITNPIGLAVTAIVALVAAGVILYQKWTPFRNFIDSIWAKLKQFGAAALDVAQGALRWLADAAKSVGSAFMSGFGFVMGIVRKAMPIIKGLAVAWMQPLRGFITYLQGVFGIFKGIFTGDLQAVKRGAIKALSGIIVMFVGFPVKVFQALRPLAKKLIPLGINAMKALGKAIARGAVAVWNFFKSLPDKAVRFARKIDSQLEKLGKSALKALATAIVRGATAVWSFFKALPGRALSLAISLNNKIGQLGRSALTAMVRAIVSAAGGVWSFFRALPSKVAGFITSLPDRLRSTGTSALRGMISGVTSAASGLWSFFSGLPNRVKSGLGSASSWLFSAGMDVIRGLISGIKSMAGSAVSAAKDVVGGAIRGAKAMLGVSSPSKVFATIGRNTIQGFNKGIRSSLKSVSKTLARMRSTIRKETAKLLSGKLTRAERRALHHRRNVTLRILRSNVVRRLNNTHRAIASINARLAQTRERLKGLREARTELNKSIRDTALGGRDLFGSMMNQIAPNPAAVVQRLRENLRATQSFTAKLRQLRDKGVSRHYITQIAQQGVEAGGQMAEVLARATPRQVRQLNRTFSDIGRAANAQGNLVANNMYNSGIRAAEGLIRGLNARKRQLTRTMNRLGSALVNAIKRRFKIRSPSRVMADEVGAPLALGIVGGLEDQQRRMDKALHSFVATPSSSAALRSSINDQSAASTNVRVFIGERELTDIVRIEVDGAQTTQARQLVHGRRL